MNRAEQNKLAKSILDKYFNISNNGGVLTSELQIFDAMEEYKNQFAPAIKEGGVDPLLIVLNKMKFDVSKFSGDSDIELIIQDILNQSNKKCLSQQLKLSDEEIENLSTDFDDLDGTLHPERCIGIRDGFIACAKAMRDNPESFLTKKN